MASRFLPRDNFPLSRPGAHFRDGMMTFAARAIAGRMDADEITAEATAQIRKIQSSGIAVSHFDTHKHTHLFPEILRPLLRAAAACGVRAVRNPFGPRLPLRSSQLLTRPGLWTRYVEVRILGAFAGKFREAVDREGFTTPDGTLGIVVTGALDETLFLRDCPQHSRRHLGIRLPSRLQRRGSAGRQDPSAGVAGDRTSRPDAARGPRAACAAGD